MANFQLNIEDWRKNHEEGICTGCVAAWLPNGGDAIYKRSYSAPPQERGCHPHIHQLLSQSPNKFKPQPLEISKRENLHTALFVFSERCPLDHSRLGFRIPTKKDVDGGLPKMRETSGIEHKPKRKKRQHSADLTSPQSLEDSSALPSNIENEGVATSCKRLKPNGPQTRKQHNSIFEPISYPTSATQQEALDDLTLDSDNATVGVDGDAPGQNIVSGNKNATKSKSEFLARYLARPNSYPDYGPLAGQTAVALPPSRSKIMAGERKTGMPGSFRPVNTLQRNGNSSSVLPRPGHKKVFDLHENNLARASDEPRATKRQKFGTENRNRRESSVSFVDISTDGTQIGTGRKTSSPNATPIKAVQSVSSRSHYQSVPSGGRLGEVDEYQRTEALVGFKGRKRRKVSDELERRRSFRVEVENGGRPQRTLLISEPSIAAIEIKTPLLGTGKGKNPILIEDLEQDDGLENSQTRKQLKSKNGISSPDPELTEVSVIAETSRYFANPKRPGNPTTDGLGAVASSPTSWVTTETLKGENLGSPDSFQSLGNGVDESQYPEDDSVDLIGSDAANTEVDQKVESKVQVRNNAIKPTVIPKSKSISQHGDIPQSAFSGVRSRKESGQSDQMLGADLSFNISYMQSGPKGFISEDDFTVWSLHYDYGKEEFDITMGDFSIGEKYPALVLKPGKIHNVKYHNDSLKVVIARALDYSSGGAGQVLVKMTTSGDAVRFAQSLKSLHSTILLSEVRSEQLDNIFNTTLRTTPLAPPKSKDIALLEVKEARRAEKLNQPANIGRRRSITTERATSATARKQSIASRMQSSTRSTASVLSESVKAVLSAGDDIFTPNRLKINSGQDLHSSRPATRASDKRSSEGQLQVRQSRSNSPVGWTTQNPHWKEEHSWEASLKFPMDAKKWTKVDAEDIERLDEGGFLNDNLVGFYLRYLQYMLEKDRPELARRVYFQNTYFYSTLVKGKVRSNNINYEAVKRWTTKDKVDIFSYDYIVVPVCEKVHWYVAIICNAPRLLPRNVPDISASKNADDTVVLTDVTPNATLGEDMDDSKHSGMLDEEKQLIEDLPASPLVIAQVEQMSLEDQEWPEPDSLPDMAGASIAQLRYLQTTETHSNDIIERNEPESHIRNGDIRHKIKKSKRKSMPPVRKHDPHDPRIITLDSLGQAHSPTCSNLREYLVCEALERHNVEIIPGRLGMTAKGLPEQSNYCDCGVFVLGYIEKFLKDPDEFIYSILQGDMTIGKTSAKFDASKMRGEIRELIFKLQADQLRESNIRHRPVSEPKKAPSIETQARLSGKILDVKSSKATKTEAVSNSPTLAGIVLRPDTRPVTGKNKAADGAKSLKTRRPSSSVLSGLNMDWADKTESESTNLYKERGPERFSSPAGAPVPTTEGSEIMETPTPSESDGVTPAEEQAFRDSSIPLESPVHSDMLKSSWGQSPGQVVGTKVASNSRAHNIFKEFAKPDDLPFQNTRNKTRHHSIELSGSHEGLPLEVRETPPRKMQDELSLEEAREPHSGPHRSNAVVLDDDGNSDPEVISPFRILTRKGGPRR